MDLRGLVIVCKPNKPARQEDVSSSSDWYNDTISAELHWQAHEMFPIDLQYKGRIDNQQYRLGEDSFKVNGIALFPSSKAEVNLAIVNMEALDGTGRRAALVKTYRIVMPTPPIQLMAKPAEEVRAEILRLVLEKNPNVAQLITDCGSAHK